MNKSINSMEDSTGFIKKLLSQMESDASFFKICEEKFDNALCYMAYYSHSATVNSLRATDKNHKNIFKELYDHKINWYYMDDDDIFNFATSTNTHLNALRQEHSSGISNMYFSIQRNIDNTEEDKTYGFTALTKPQHQQFIRLLTTHKKFCRETKQKIKDLFEIKKKQFEKSAKKEGYSLNQLSQLTNTLENALAESNFTNALNTWAQIKTWYTNKSLQNKNSGRTVTDKTYLIIKNYISNFIKTKISDLCNSIIEKLESYIDAYRGKDDFNLTYKEQRDLENSRTTLKELISQCVAADNAALESIGTSAKELLSLRDFMHDNVNQFLNNSGKTKICDIKITFYMTGVRKILNKWK